jgi:protocatechuate 3,4-dioxygenase beta subunit
MKPLIIALLFIVSMNSSAQDSSLKPEPCTVQGIVTAVATRAPLKSAWVALRAVPPEDQSSRQGPEDGLFKEITDANGHFVINGVPPGKYQFRAGKTGYVPGDYSLDGGPPKATLVLHPSEKLDKVEFRLSRTAVIMGRVTDETGEPIAGVYMEADPTGTRMGDSFPEDPFRFAVTNDLGEYRINDLPPGSYYFSATDSGTSVWGKWPSWSEDRYANHLTIYYRDATKNSEAQKVRLSAGQEMRIDFSLRTVKLLSISGRLLRADGKPAAQVRVNFRPQDPYSSIAALELRRFGVTTDANGDFVIREVLPGSYVVSATVVSPTLNEEEFWTEKQIEVAKDNVSGMVLQLRKELQLSGKMNAKGGPKFDFQRLHIWLGQGNEPNPGTWPKIKKDGTFTIPKVRPTTLRLTVYPLPKGWYLRSAFFGKQNVFENGLRFSAAGSHESLDLTFSPTAGRIEGVVFRGDDPAYGAPVRIFPDPANPNNTGLYRGASADEDGHFDFDSVVPGRYRVVAYASERTDGDGGSPYDDSVSASVIIAEKESKTLNLKLPRREE